MIVFYNGSYNTFMCVPIVLESSLQVLGLPKSFVICELVEQSKLKHEKAFSDRLINRNTKGSNKRSKKQSKSGFLLQSQTPKHKEIKRKPQTTNSGSINPVIA